MHSEIRREIYKSLRTKCKFIDENPALRNVFMSEPSHLFSIKAKNIQRINVNHARNQRNNQFFPRINNGCEYFDPRHATSLTSMLNQSFAIDTTLDSNVNDTNFLQSSFEAMRFLNKTENFMQHLSDEKYQKYREQQQVPKFEIMDELDKDLLCRGGIAFVQHPMAVDVDRMHAHSKPFEIRKVMIGFKYDDKNMQDLSYLIAMNKPLNEKISEYTTIGTNRAGLPSIFANNDALYGGVLKWAYNSLTTNPHCEGKPVLNGSLFLNPDKQKAEELVLSNEATVGDFRFYAGFETFYDVHLENLLKRKKYFAVNLESLGGGNLERNQKLLLDLLWNNEQVMHKKWIKNDMWDRMVSLMGDEYAESWLKIPDSMYYTPVFDDLCTEHYDEVNDSFAESNKSMDDFMM